MGGGCFLFAEKNEKDLLPKIAGSYKKMSVFLKINFADTTFYKNKKILQIRLFIKIRGYDFS